MREYEIGSEVWIRERIERGLDCSEADRFDDDRGVSLRAEHAGWAAQPADVDWAWIAPDIRT